MLKSFKSLKLSYNKISKTIQNNPIKNFGSKDNKHGVLGWLTESARKAAVSLNDAMEKLGVKRSPPRVENPYENYGKIYKSPGTTQSDNSKSFATNPQKEAQDNIKRGMEGKNKNQPTQHGQHGTYGSAGLGTSEPPYGSHTITDYKTYEEEKKPSENNLKISKLNENNFGSSEAGKKSFAYRGEGFSGGIAESGSMDISENSNITSGSISAGAMGSSEAGGYSGTTGTFRKTSSSSSEHGFSGLGATSGSSGIAAGAGTSGSMYGASGPGAATSQNSTGIGGTSGTSGGEGFAHKNNTFDSSSDRSEIQGAYTKVESSSNKNKEDTNREKTN